MHETYAAFPGRIVMVGFGSIGQGVLPLLLRHLGVTPERITIIEPRNDPTGQARALGVVLRQQALTRENHVAVLNELLRPGDFLLNVSFDVSSLALIEYCQERGVLYVDTCIEPWPGGHTDPGASPSQRSNYAFREAALALKRAHPAGPTAIVNHGANPGLVSHFTKQALLDIAVATGVSANPNRREDWARLAMQLGVKVIHIAERDTQLAAERKQPGEFVNTWSVEAFAGEICQPVEIGWGSHERHFPPDGARHGFGSDAAIYLNRPGAATRVRSWTPLEGPYHGFLITHGESISIADNLTVREGGRVRYRPTVHYAYHPCDATLLSLHEFAGKNWQLQPRWRIPREDLVSGRDELGVLLMGHGRGAYWYGSQLSIEETRELVPYNNATSLQVTISIVAAMAWAIRHPELGICEPDDLDFRAILAMCRPYLGTMAGVFTDWTPLLGRNHPFPEDLDLDDPWQFKNFRVA
ncbi:MAG: homospermidine synthase [Hydrogenophilaceae bacterium]|nr:homospermidine synthase [Hydrogenophilaceae bacterium]